jgi:N12 class adenine-specific DNA methylase
VFDEHDSRWAPTRAKLRGLVGDTEWAAARRSTLNAHYTSAEVITALWSTVTDVGFDGGRVLEPGCGSGNFIGLTPDGLDVAWTGVELDPLTARITAALYPHADIRAESFADTRIPDGTFDLTIGNVPFGKITLHDPRHNPGRLSIHNHFITKSLALTRPGGIVAVVTSRFTLDARNPAARNAIAAHADLIGAVRLPANTFREAAGTDVVCDIVLLRRRHPDEPPGPHRFEHTTEIETSTGPATANEYFADHPQRILGELVVGGGQYGRDDIDVRPTGPLAPQLAKTLNDIAADARTNNLTYTPAALLPAGPAEAVVFDRAEASWKEGSIQHDGTRFVRVVDGNSEPFEAKPAKAAKELRSLLRLRDSTRDLLAAQATSTDDTTFADLQRDLNRQYDSYTRAYGPLNRFKLSRTGRVDADTGEERVRQLRPTMGGFRIDPDYPTVLALEIFDPDTGTATKAPIFSQRVVAPPTRRLDADTPADALAIALDETGHVDLDRIAELLHTDHDDARHQLATLVWDSPATGDLEPAGVYLAGDVRTKLDDARAAALRDPRFETHVRALEAVVPVDLEPVDIDARLGASWISTADIKTFCAEVLDCRSVDLEYIDVNASWTLKAPSWARGTVTMTSEWGTGRADALTLVDASLNQRLVSVYDTTPDGARVLNAPETLAAREKQDALGERFATWVWENPERAERLAEIYNRRFNSTVLPTFDGSHLTFPGMAVSFTPHQHQRDAVWRIASQPSCLLAHVVGAGKTATMVAGAMELKRLGLAAKPAIVVPNHMLEQFAREAKLLYPQANLLVAGKDDTTPAERKHFVARCATGDWDLVVITHSSFERIPVSAARRADYIAAEIDEYRAAADASRVTGGGLSVKKLEAEIERLRAKHETLINADAKDDGVTFEECGIDYVMIDEAHLHKNLPFPTRIQGIGGAGSQRAQDLKLKLAYLRERNPGHVATFATATPVANSVSEMYVMQAYLQPDTLRRAGVERFDAWAANFGSTVTALELAPEGASYRMSTRFARFRNVPDLLKMFTHVADVRTAGDLNLPVPTLEGGHAETVIVPASDGLKAYVDSLAERAEKVRNRTVRPDEDNMLAVTGDGRRAALDLRLVGRTPDPAGGKSAAAAERVAAIYRTTRDRTYLDDGGQPAARNGSLQLVFCDLGTPKPGEWSVYSELRAQLIAQGVPEAKVRFIHEATNDRAKADLFAACRDGRVAVLVGSTEKMGVGTNVQRRAVALHHLDCPWRPADLEQREGRIIRQGNQNDQVRIIRYATEESFDIYMWQTVERKATFISQVTNGRVDGRQVDDIGDQALSYAEVKALATGNPLIMEKAGIDAEVAKLTRLRDAHRQDQQRLGRTYDACTQRADTRTRLADACEQAIAQRIDTHGDKFTMTVDTNRFTDRTEAGAQLHATLHRILTHPRERLIERIGAIGGFDLEATLDRRMSDDLTITLVGTPLHLTVERADLKDTDPHVAVGRLERKLRSLEHVRDEALADANDARHEAGQAHARIGATFEHTDRLQHLLGRQAQIAAELTPPEPVPPPTPEPPAVVPIGLER